MAFPNGEVRHQTPNECAAALGDQAIRVMPELYLQEFAELGEVCRVTRNGFTLNNSSYGRFDPELMEQEFVTVYSCPDVPDAVYVEELGRCVTAYLKAAPGDYSQLEPKRRIERIYRNKLEEAYAKAKTVEAGKPTILEAVQVFEDPAPGRRKTFVEVPALKARAEAMRLARRQMKEEDQAARRRFDFETPMRTEPARAGSRRRSLLAVSGALKAALPEEEMVGMREEE
jgi:hypothetical protein